MKPDAKARFETLNINYYIEYIGECMTLNRKILCFFGFFKKLTPQLIKLNIPTHD